MSFNFIVDSKIKGRGYPALAQWQARPYTSAWREFGCHWPFTIPLRLDEYCKTHKVPIHYVTPDEPIDTDTFYPIALDFFDFDFDYLFLLPNAIKILLQTKKIKILFFYHEGDNPFRMRQRLDQLAVKADIDILQIKLVCSNSAADLISGCTVFHDFELWYYQRNHNAPPASAHLNHRPYDFLCMNRLHKSWREAVMAHFYFANVLVNSRWSYCEAACELSLDDCPIELDRVPGLRSYVEQFRRLTPKFIDNLDNHARNDHSHCNLSLYETAYCNIVIESQFDVDQSNGCFLTEKTFKALKNAQLFFVAGGPGSIENLRRLGYDVFDDWLDHSYDSILDATDRLTALSRSISKAQAIGLEKIYSAVSDRILSNQQLFLNVGSRRLNMLWQKIKQL